MVPKSELEKVIKSLIGHAFPVLKGIPFPVKGRITRVYQAGTMADIEMIESTGTPNPSILPKLRVPAGQVAEVGKEVRLGFYYGDPSQPFIDEVLS